MTYYKHADSDTLIVQQDETHWIVIANGHIINSFGPCMDRYDEITKAQFIDLLDIQIKIIKHRMIKEADSLSKIMDLM